MNIDERAYQDKVAELEGIIRHASQVKTLDNNLIAELEAQIAALLAAIEAKDAYVQQSTQLLEAIVQKAGEIMRERVLAKREAHQVNSEAIRALPGVTLKDLK